MTLFEPIFAALERAGVRYVTVGGVAVVLHGHARFTADLDLVVDLAAIREQWITQQAMTVFSLWDPDDPLRSVDLFIDHPIDFEGLWERSMVVDIEGMPVRVASITDLIRLKRIADRPMGREDIAALEAIEERVG